jgi:hypothetical protein
LIAGAEAADYTLDLAHAQLVDNVLLTSDTCDADLTLENKPVVFTLLTLVSHSKPFKINTRFFKTSTQPPQ